MYNKIQAVIYIIPASKSFSYAVFPTMACISHSHHAKMQLAISAAAIARHICFSVL
jgi:hypothetical protein